MFETKTISPGHAPGTRTDLEFTGDFDCETAARAGTQLLQALPSSAATVHLDFRRVHTVQDAALARLAETLRAVGPTRVVIHGLSHHHGLILHYLGVELSRFDG